MREDGLSDSSINNYTRTLKVFFSWCNEQGYTKTNLKIYKASETVKETYTDDELMTLLRKPESNCNFCEYRNWVIINFLLNSGCRAATVRNIQNQDVDLSRKDNIEALQDMIILSQLEGCGEAKVQRYFETKQLASKPFVLWHLDFARVFREKGGFDIVIGNPPYGLLNKNQNQNTSIKANEYEFLFCSCIGTKRICTSICLKYCIFPLLMVE